MDKCKKSLHLLPNLLGNEASLEDFPKKVFSIVLTLDGLIAESEKAARKYLRFFMNHEEMQKVQIVLLNEHTKAKEVLDEMLKGGSLWGLISDAGLPCLADPGSQLVSMARKKGVSIHALMGPSSIMLALMLSGFSGQRFSFHGYLPRKEEELIRKIKNLEKEAYQSESTQIWIEAPYRSNKMLHFLIKSLKPQTLVCVAKNLTFQDESVMTMPVRLWKEKGFSLKKEPAVFLVSKDIIH